MTDSFAIPAYVLMRERWITGCLEHGREVTEIGVGAVLDPGERSWEEARLLELVDAANYHWCEIAERIGSADPADWPDSERIQLRISVDLIENLRARVNRKRRMDAERAAKQH